MADVIRKSTNRFTRGLVMDFSPENTKNEVLTHALNATLLTFNGNELSLQNDMGNARVETAYLPAGYIPVGTCEYGGIIYIVSYNPLENKSQIGCFPSPERNITREELGEPNNTYITNEHFQVIDKSGNPTGELVNNTQYVLLKNSNLNPGDKFIINANEGFTDENLVDLWVKNEEEYVLKENPILSLSIVSIEDSGKIVHLNSTTRQYEFDNYKYHIVKNSNNDNYLKQEDIDQYRNVLSSGYSVFRSKTSGKLAILAELIMIDSYSVTHYLKPGNEKGQFDIMLSTEVSPEVTKDNFNLVPKLKFYYLQNSQGYLQTYDKTAYLFDSNNLISNVKLSDIYTNSNSVPTDTLGKLTTFDFPRADTYHNKFNPYEGDINENVYTKFIKNEYHRVHYDQVINSDRKVKEYFNSSLIEIYRYLGGTSDYIEFKGEVLDNQYSYYIKEISYTYQDVNRDVQYKDENLYKISTNPTIAGDEIKKNTTIEKFKYQEVIGYEPISIEDIKNLGSSEKVYYKGEDGKYYQFVEDTPNINYQYYKEVVEQSLISIGTADATESTGVIYYFPSEKTYTPADQEDKDKYYDTDTYPNDPPFILYRVIEHDNWRIATEEEKSNFDKYELYYRPDYVKLEKGNTIHGDYSEQLFVVFYKDAFVNYGIFQPNEEYNWIKGKNKPEGEFPKDAPVELYIVSEYLIDIEETYGDIKLASIKLPTYIVDNELDLPFKYSYTIVPCMNYGKLDHLKISNTIDFGNLHAFDQSKFNIWKYYVQDEQLRLTFGAEVFDTYEEYKVDGLVLEFYDCWGFAGSIEVTNKKSYSGIFNKTIPLNTLGVISTKKIDGNSYIESQYIRNIQILPKGETSYEFNGKECNKDIKTGFSIDKSNNDCGTLYSNVVYGVKTYLRKTTEHGYEFVEKDNFFLYTLPIYNDYYYSVENFSTLENPGLDFVLTYKLTDEGERKIYNSDGYINGYNQENKDTVDNYLKGNSENVDIKGLIKYYQYTGISKVALEIGLNKDYENLNIRCNPDINKEFSCTLELISDDGSSVSVQSSEIGAKENIKAKELYFSNTSYSEEEPYEELLEFNTDKDGSQITNSLNVFNIRNYNFINQTDETRHIEIKYDFIVGYDADIINIRNTQVPSTTICALCHQQDDGTWNYEDFGVYTKEDGDGNLLYLSNAMFYNEGDFETEVFGVCKQVNLEGVMASQLSIIRSIESSASKITVPGKLNSGEPLRQLSSHIGKLTFCQPHAHGLSEINGVNVHCSDPDTKLYYAVSPDIQVYGGDYADDTKSIVPTQLLFKYPIYNLSLNTYDSIKYNSEFISTLQYSVLTNVGILGSNLDGPDKELTYGTAKEAREFTGFTGKEVEKFNKYMVETMKSVYAYNPDYNQLNVNVGEAVVQNHYPVFTSNLISKNATIKGDNINEYIYLGTISFSYYLKELFENSGIEINECVKFKPNLTYCGGNTPYLITSLTYNTLVPKELKEELEFNSSDIIMVRHANKDIIQLKGSPDKKILYGFDNNSQKLIQLDVSNYSINDDGILTITNQESSDDDFVYVSRTTKYSDIRSHIYTTYKQYLNTCLKGTSITLNDLIYEPNQEGHRLFMRNNLCSFDSYLRGKLFYRYLNIDINGNQHRHDSWRGEQVGNQNINTLYLYTGPCFNKDNLLTNDE